MKIPVTNINFNKAVVQKYTTEQFVAKFGKIYPHADLHAHAKKLGLVNEPAAEDNNAPATPSKPRPKRKAKGGK